MAPVVCRFLRPVIQFMVANPKDDEIAFFRYRNRLMSGVFHSGESGKVRFKISAKESLNVPKENVVLLTGEIARNQGEAKAWLEKVEQWTLTLNLEEVWELIKEENEAWSLVGLADLCLEEGATPLAFAGLLVGLDNSSFFKYSKDGFLALTDEEVAEIRAAEEKESARAEEKGLFQGWLDGQEESVEAKEYVDTWVPRLMDYVLYGDTSVHSRWLAKMVDERVDTKRVFNRLVKEKIWQPDEHLDLIRQEIPISFSEGSVAATKELVIDLNGENRRDLRDLPVYTIDDARTTDMDDGVSLLFREDGSRQLGIHITDVSGLVPVGSVLDLDAYDRISSLYFPDQKLPMLPKTVSSDLGSLTPGDPRLALSLLFEVTGDNSLGDAELVPSIVESRGKLSYEEVDGILDDPADPRHSQMQSLHSVAEAHWMERLHEGAIDVDHPERRILVSDSGDVEVSLQTQNSASNLLVSELMVLANVAIARFCNDNDIPVVYRVQQAPDLSGVEEVENSVLRRYRVLRQMSMASLSEEPGLHGGLGVSSYCQATSPLRRFADLAVQRQVMAFLRGQPPPYGAEEIRSMLFQAGEQLRDIIRLERKRERYWLYKYLQKFVGETFEGMVLDVSDRELRVEVLAYAFQTRVKPARNVTPGERVEIKLVKSDPWEDSITFSLV
jgi:exoribonuclease-2